jgi:hypothetical protein
LIVDARQRKALVYLTFAGLAGLAVYEQFAQRTASDSTVKATSGATAMHLTRGNGTETRPSLGLPSSTERPPLGAPRAELFAPHTWQPPAREAAEAPPVPIPPAIPFRFAGTLLEGGVRQILLSRGDTVFSVKVGETLDATYLVESIGEDEVVFVYLPLQSRQRIPIDPTIAVAEHTTSAQPHRSVEAAPPGVPTPSAVERTAKLEWVGPQQVRIGEAFDVALRVSSNEPVQTAPVQVRFDPKVLESVAIRPGRIFGAAPPKFTYRINPDGTIVVEAAATAPMDAAADELMVFTFKAVAPTTEASLAVTTTGLEDSGGHAIAVEQLSTYRTTVSR